MRDKPKNPFVPMSLGTSRTEIHVFSYETQGQDRDKLGTNRDKGQGTRIYRYAVPMSQHYSAARPAVFGVGESLRPAVL